MLEKMEEFDTEKVIEEVEAMSKEAGRVQRETLKRILEENGSSEYLQNLGLNGNTDPESFKACVPIVTHEDLEPYIQRIADSHHASILTAKPITTISLRDFPIGKGRSLMFIYGSKQFKTNGGLTAATATSNLYRDPKFKSTMKSIMSMSCSPDEVIYGSDFHQSLYCHLLCGLIFRDEIQLIFSTFAHSIVHAFRTFEHIWEELCCDIRNGILTSRITSPSIRAGMSNLLKPNPELADLVYEKCVGLSTWYGLIPQLFPNAKYIYGIMTGSMEPYVKKLRHYAGDLPLMSADYGSSEGWIGANINPKLSPEFATFTVLPNIGYFEFIPLGEISENDKSQSSLICSELKPVDLTQVQVGKEYEILITSVAGMYRYRLGDVVKVTGFYNSTPELKFVCRRNLLLTINIDKNTEKDLQIAVGEASKLLAEEKLEVVDFTSYVDRSTDPGHYVIFWEMSGEAYNDDLLNRCCNRLDTSFVDAGYVSSRRVKSIGALELRVVQRGTFQKILDHFLSLGAAVSQFKTPRCIGPANNKVLQILCSNVIKVYFSTAFQ
ncbi:jasmonic acid-amido synthetase JAR1-like isoform X2 [Momordica charantia]|uniref:Jasmonic acid-amido synthetase JAR1-like isoform X2 n=1 Tax=Momordica charantia TaxID=3673 RepID=A0A6J1DWB6_MOMCH|nr:jasmonic acid-amido synthetase JAR1-like isoform X2 [Momordica charantia]